MNQDITMCTNEKCPKRMECYRYRAVPDGVWQSYFAPAPKGGKKCKYFTGLMKGDRLTRKRKMTNSDLCKTIDRLTEENKRLEFLLKQEMDSYGSGVLDILDAFSEGRMTKMKAHQRLNKCYKRRNDGQKGI